uniref:Nitric oxide synthase trafficking n=1 Tax=Chelydra serpentina TaxID=8475 RepID=A0A8C3XJ73_CHESE
MLWFSKNGENFCKQLRFVLQQRYMGSAAISNRENVFLVVCVLCYVPSKRGRAIQLEAISSTNHVLDEHEKNKKSDNAVEKSAKLVVNNWSQQMKAKIKEHEALFHYVENTKQFATGKKKQKLLRRLEKSATKMTKEDEDYYQKNISGYETRLTWETALENSYQSILDLAKERLQLLCNVLNTYNQHLSSFGQNLIDCHTQVHSAVSQVDAEKDIQSLLEEKSVSSPETKSEFLLMDYYVSTAQGRQLSRQKASIKAKVLRLQDLNKAAQEKEGSCLLLFRKTSLLQANICKLSTVLAELEQKPKPTHPWNTYNKLKSMLVCLNTFGHKAIKLNFKKLFIITQNMFISSCFTCAVSDCMPMILTQPRDSNPANGTCKALYDYQAKRDDELSLQKGDFIIIHQKDDNGTLKERNGHFPATYVEEFPTSIDETSSEA